MLWLQSWACFAVWVGYGVWLARSDAAKRFLPRSRGRIVVGPLLFVLGMAVLVGGLAFVGAQGGLVDGALSFWALGVVAVCGLVFVHAQCAGAMMLIATARRPETRPASQASVRTEDPR